ncbi:SsrA-binding protein [Candidatus Roizmanbacteria bacterium CG17_big_fil_post_rev_8_21_14_2_50_39_7]|uniref:SsrA-binding protein n=1 Tax=Candidatus Roizmanbacteria bacterium CG17_big_fil_post_rev_8_21_14_2_50_39_7 TaxID=1974858 RepID=A0A2M7EL08_9BACT|nr:MAG: SsrA-binding protein [Candidatus Roizmanbacteria bacterium CG17_big_fil_post_rev_8_21_14_2_50_39_7]
MKVINRKLSREYEILETVEAGIVLNGPETKSVFLKQINLDAAYVKLLSGEAYLINADIQKYQFAKQDEYDPKKSRKLLLHKKELLKLQVKTASKGFTLVPVSCYSQGPYIKIEIAVVRGRKDLEKKKIQKKQDIIRNEKREMKEYLKMR